MLAKSLTFTLGIETCSLEPVKLERKKVYGWTETRATDDSGAECQLVNLEESGSSIIPKGGIGLGMLDPNGLWVIKSELVALDANGSPAQAFPSSFDAPIELAVTASVEQLLNHNVTSVYCLAPSEPSAVLLKALTDGTIFTFPFSYRGGFEQSTAFLLLSNETLFLLTGEPVIFEFIGLAQSGVIDEAEDDVAEESDELDFSMM